VAFELSLLEHRALRPEIKNMKKSPKAFHLILLGIVLVALVAGMLGIDFGYHWDEAVTINSVGVALCAGSFLPSEYHYPSFSHGLCFFGLLSHLVPLAFASGIPSWPQIKIALLFILGDPLFKLHTRILFMGVSYLSVVWLYILMWQWRHSWQEALLAAALLGLSWEVSYHARFIASDALLMQFGALTMMCLSFDFNSVRSRRWLVLAAAAAGFACGTKYQGILLLAPVCYAAHYDCRQRAPGNSCWRMYGRVFLAFALAYLVTTPGTFLKPFIFLSHVKSQFFYYSRGHGGHAVTSPMEYLLLLSGYFSFALFSRYPAISFIFFAMALSGAALIIRDEKGRAAVLLSFPLLYIALMSFQKMMMVRNFLVVIPFFALFAGRGFGFLRSRINSYAARTTISAAVVLLLLVNACWLIEAGLSIRDRKKTECVAQLAAYLDRQPDTQFLVSQKVAQALAAHSGKHRCNVTCNPGAGAKTAVLYASEVTFRERWVANRFSYTRKWFGPYEVNFNYYPDWAGDDRIVVVPARSASGLGVFDAL
jgi:hypothetical protein